MTKDQIHRLFIDKLSSELDTLTAAAKHSASLATDEAHRAESKYDTFSLESSYLARGQAMRVEELRHTLQRLQAMTLASLDARTPIRLGALVRLSGADGSRRTLFFGPAAGGEKVDAGGEEVIVVTALSPLGKVLLGKTVGSTFDFSNGRASCTYTVTAVE